jgi:short-subunit dehydrogenase
MKNVAVITGASSGLGCAFARLLAARGYNPVLVARREARLTQLKKELEENYNITAYVCACDLTDPDAAMQVYEYVKEKGLVVNILINNAGFGAIGNFSELDWKKQNDMVQIFITTQMHLQFLFLQAMLSRGEGRILNISSVSAFFAGPGMAVYYACKEYIRSFTEAVAEEVKGSGVTLTAMCFGPTDTDFEKAMNIGKTKMFSGKLMEAEKVAEYGLNAMMKGKVLAYCGSLTKAANILSRLLPRSIMRKVAAHMNR